MKLKPLFIFLVFLYSFAYSLANEPSKKVTIVYNSGIPPLKFTDRENKANGMLIDIWKLWGKKNNIDIEFKELPWKDTIEAVKNGKADIHGGIYYTKERDQFFDYPRKPLYENKNYFFYYKRIENIGSKKDLEPFVVGIGNGYPNKFMRENYPNINVKSFNSSDEVSKAFINGEVKVILSAMPTFMYYVKANLIDDSNFKYSSETFAYKKEYFGAVKEGNKELIDLINDGFEKITPKELKQIELKWTVDLDMNFLKHQKYDKILTTKQKEYLGNKKSIKMCVDPMWLPFEKIEKGDHVGLVADIYGYFTKTLGIPIELVPTKTWAESLENAKTRKCDILSAAAITPKRLEYLNFTKPYLKFPQVIVTREKEKFIEEFEDIIHKRIGVVKNSAISELLKEKYPGINLFDVKNVLEGLYKVSSGELYGFVNTSAAVNYAISKNGMSDLKVASKAGIDYYLRIAVRKDDITLLNILDNVILSIDDKFMREIKDKWLHVKVEQIINYNLIWKILGIFSVILGIVLFFLIKQNRLKALIEEQKRAFEDIYQKSTDPILLMENNKLIDCNESTVKILGYETKEQFLNMHPSKLSPLFQSDGQPSFEKSEQHLKEAHLKGYKRFEWLHTKANGENFWVDVILTKININNKDMIHVVWRDIQEQKEIERELTLEKEQLDRILTHIPVPVLIVSKKTKDILFANNYASTVYKLPIENLEGNQVNIIYTKDNQREEILKAVNEDGVLINYETTYKASDGSHIDALLSLIPIKFQNENANLGVITDVTHLKKIQAELEKESIKAKEATSAKSDFLAKMSHEIRTPMNAILGMLYLVEKTTLNSMQESYIDKANSAAKALLNIVDDILDISKIEAGKLTLEYKNFTFNDMLHDIMGIMSYRAEEKGLELLAYYDRSIPRVIKSDRHRIGQILNNLISNAIKFTSKGEVVVSTKLIKKETNNITVMFCVKDSGIGISKSAQEKLFEDFSQGDNSITRKYGGTGLGLSISKKLTQMLGGRIWIEESIENIGSTFCFTIQCESENDSQQNDDYYFPKEINNINTLIIDDNEVASDVLKSMLRGFGFNVDTVHSGMKGYEALKENSYDIIFLDYKMPELDGIDTYKRIKGLKGEDTPKTIMVTASSQSDIVSKAKKMGIEGYLIKPAAPSTLYDTILEILAPHMQKDKKVENDRSYESMDFHGAKILLVEDNELNQDFALQLLENANIKVDVANDGIEALAFIKNKSYEAVLMDIQMPNMDGLTATKFIRKMGEDESYFRDIPIIALSANALHEDRQKSYESGMNEHISKPIIPKELFGELSRYINSTCLDSKGNPVIDSEFLEDSIDENILDIKEVLERIDGNLDTYKKLLKKFAKKYSKADKIIIDLINNDKLLDASKKVHEVKGVAGNLGAVKVFNTLTAINQDLRENKTPEVHLQEELKESLNEVIKFISNSIDIEKDDDIEFNKNIALEGLRFIKDNIEDDIMACEDQLAKLTPFFNNTVYEEKFSKLKEEYNEFDTDSMLLTIKDLIKEINAYET